MAVLIPPLREAVSRLAEEFFPHPSCVRAGCFAALGDVAGSISFKGGPGLGSSVAVAQRYQVTGPRSPRQPSKAEP